MIITTNKAFQDFQFKRPWPRSRSLISRSNVENGSKIRIGPFVNSSHLMDVVHFQDLSLTFDRTDPYLFFEVSYDTFGLVSMVTEF